MPFKKGTSGNKKGRPKGSPNRTTKFTRNTIKRTFDEVFTVDSIKSDLESLKPIERLQVFTKLVDYICVKPKEEEDDDSININKLSEDELDAIIGRLWKI